MRPFTLRQFKNLEYKIPNLHPDYRCIESTSDSGSFRSTTLYTYQVHRRAISEDILTILGGLSSIHSNSIDPDWLTIFSISKSGYLREYDNPLLQHLGLVNKNPSYCVRELAIDALYYKSNPLEPFNKVSRTIKKSTWSVLRLRTNSAIYGLSPVTKNLLQTVVDKISPEFQNSVVLLTNFLESKSIYTKTCYITNKIIPSHFSKDIYLSNTHAQVTIDSEINLEDYGYTKHYLQNAEAVWLRDDIEILINGSVYQREGLVLCTCPQCNTETPQQSIVADEGGLCEMCVAKKYKIHNYSTKVPDLLKFKAKRVKQNTIYLGIELEYESSNRDKAKIIVGRALANHAIMKQDGSIRMGFEIVSCPATLDIHLEEFKKLFDIFPKELYAASNTGMHVHVSRKPLNYLTIGRMTEFLNREDNKKFIEFIAGRIDNRYAQMTKSRTITFPFITYGGHTERYNALNLQNKDTIEFRIFSSPKNWEEFSARLEFVQALTDYCGPCQSSQPLKEQTKAKTFLQWLGVNRKAYPEFSNYMKGYQPCV